MFHRKKFANATRFCCVTLINRSWRNMAKNQTTPTYLSRQPPRKARKNMMSTMLEGGKEVSQGHGVRGKKARLKPSFLHSSSTTNPKATSTDPLQSNERAHHWLLLPGPRPAAEKRPPPALLLVQTPDLMPFSSAAAVCGRCRQPLMIIKHPR
jgi:hypothetical protein